MHAEVCGLIPTCFAKDAHYVHMATAPTLFAIRPSASPAALAVGRLALSAVLLACASTSALAQDESALRNAFMGRNVAILVDMPASHKGVDLRFDRSMPFDIKENSDRMREHDASLLAGDVIPVTFVKVKGDLIEFHLGGGGFNWYSESTTKTPTLSSKTVRETEIEKELKIEADRDRKRRLERELDDIKRDRDIRDARERRAVDEYNLRAREVDLERALRSGSRFNLRFKREVPRDALTPEGFARYLAPWVDFSDQSDRPRPTARPATSAQSAREPRDWKRGTPRRDMEDALGRPRRERSCSGDDSGLDCRIATFDDGADEIDATFVEGVLVRFSTRRR